jgi:hypothetical protein
MHVFQLSIPFKYVRDMGDIYEMVVIAPDEGAAIDLSISRFPYWVPREDIRVDAYTSSNLPGVLTEKEAGFWPTDELTEDDLKNRGEVVEW